MLLADRTIVPIKQHLLSTEMRAGQRDQKLRLLF